MALLAIDLGNTNLTWGCFEGEDLVANGALANTSAWSLPDPAWGELSAAAVASVQTESARKLREGWNWDGAPELCFLEEDRPIPVGVQVESREQVGADRLVNCLAWHHRSTRPAIIVDFGSAITLDVVSHDGDYLGGLILPGPAMLAGALHEKTALLPRVSVAPTGHPVGKDTESCIQEGVFGLMVGGVAHHLRELRRVLPDETVAVATGGAAPRYAPAIDGIEMVLPFLTLEGIRLAYERSDD